ncbi:reverse transcriptase [Phytophthora megakarya]|uniref:Reverse transcriptase n=1 Tax=Phytophthora megakarya TaxID=4795 RepID=A0A225WGL8_9STRA|nr:reverse transcriptase [Phytophthora megakarya]
MQLFWEVWTTTSDSSKATRSMRQFCMNCERSAATMKDTTQAQIQRVLKVENVDQESQEDQVQDLTEVDLRWIHAYKSFGVLQSKITITPILRHFDPDRRATVMEYDKTYNPCIKDKDEILGALIASITPRSDADKALILLAPKKEPRRKIQTSTPTIKRDKDLYAIRRVKRGGGAYSAILWKLPECSVLKARSGYDEGLTANEEEYHGLLLRLNYWKTWIHGAW